MNGPIAKKIEVNGIVQGVGFRPFVFQAAQKHHLRGHVANTAAGVVIHAQGAPASMAAFLADLEHHPPPLAHIVEMAVQEASPGKFKDFTIIKSVGGQQRATLISPDVAVCSDCLSEMFDPRDRRFGYPFINCTNCGPRYTIVDDVPYDRPKTAMRHFTMCPLCQAEYDDPANRRFHAQPNGCPQCGPRVALYEDRRTRVASDDPIAQCAQWIKDGGIVAVKGLGGFHLCVDAFNDAAVERLRERKQREEKPLAVMSGDVETISTYAHVTPEEREHLESIQRPIVLLAKKMPEKLAFSVAPRNHYYGVMLPYTPLHYLLLRQGFTALVMTSANLSEEPICIDNDDAFDRLNGIADYFLIHNRDIYLRSDDTIVRRAGHEMRQIRRSRGYVPIPIFLKSEMPPVLACGAELKNTVCLTKGRQAFVSQHIGDLENLATEQFFQLTVDHLKRILDISPEQVVCDLHPDYLSTQWAKSRHGAPLQVQHHFAHVAACMAENRLAAPVIGLAFDGTGYGPDGTIWGGELLVADLAGYRRVAHFETTPMPGSAAAIKAPIRMALAYLHHVYGPDLWELGLPAIDAMDRNQADIIVQMCRQRINAPLTSSLGRLFDGVAAIIGLRRTVAFEGQAAMELEMMAQDPTDEYYDFEWQSAGAVKQIALAPIITGVVNDVQIGMPAFIIGRKFHNTIIRGCAELCAALGQSYGLNQVVLSGGCFQNRLLLEGLTEALVSKGMDVYSHRLVPSNDGGISLGQAVIGGALAAGKKSRVA